MADLDCWTEYERENGYLRVRLRLLTTDEGGRKTPIYDGYRASWRLPMSEPTALNDAPLLIEGGGSLGPGEVSTVRLHPLAPEYWIGVVWGHELPMFEGPRLVGVGEVLEVDGSKR